MTSTNEPFSVICLCAEWCGTCREYRTGFEDVAARFPGVRFHWVDIEDQADTLGDLDIENFPTLLINRGTSVLYYGVMLPYPDHLVGILESFHEYDAHQSQTYAHSHSERRQWQGDSDLRELVAHFS